MRETLGEITAMPKRSIQKLGVEMDHKILIIQSLTSDDLNEILISSMQEGFRFVERLLNEYEIGTNKFDQPGEILLGCYVDSKLVGICGLNRQAMEGDMRVGRIRRFYVLPHIGRLLIEYLLKHASSHFNMLVLRTDNLTAAMFYEVIGFTRVDSNKDITHYINID